MPTLSIVIVNYNSGDYLTSCLNSIRSQTWRDLEVIVVDNHSADDSLSGLSAFPEVKLICNSSNLGFATSQNQGLAIAQGRYLMALNFDLLMDPVFIERLLTALDSHLEAGWACGKLLAMQKDGQPLNILYAAGHILPPNGFPLLRGNGEIDRGQYDRLEFVDGAPGAAALYRHEMIDDIRYQHQFFDETFFTWYEDVDVDWRARLRGWNCLYVPSAIACHVGHVGEDYPEPFRSWRASIGIRNRWLMILTNKSFAELRSHAGALLKYELSSLFFVVRQHLLRAYLCAVRDVFRLGPYIKSKRHWVQSRRRTRPAQAVSSLIED